MGNFSNYWDLHTLFTKIKNKIKSVSDSIGNGTLTIQKNGTTLKTFSANQAGNETVNITVPTKTSELTNNSNFVADSSYVHTDNNYTTAEKTKLSGIASGAEANVQSDWDQTTTTADDYIKNKPSLASVATSGSYNDLSNKPTIPTALSQLTADSTHRLVTDTEKSTWNGKATSTDITNAINALDVSSVGGSGKYISAISEADGKISATATNFPTIPAAANNGTLTIKRNGTNVATFTANQSSNSEADISVPTKTSDLTNDSNYLTKGNLTDGTITSGVVIKGRVYGTGDDEGIVINKANNNYATLTLGTHNGERTLITLMPDGTAKWRRVTSSGSSGDIIHPGKSGTIALTSDIPTALSGLTDDATHRLVTDTEKSTWNGKAATTDITNAINALDVSSVGGSGKYISAISETDGKISATATNFPTIPAAANNGTLTIQKNGTNVQTFTANQSTNATANITVPTALSGLTDDATHRLVTDTEKSTWNGKQNALSLPMAIGQFKARWSSKFGEDEDEYSAFSSGLQIYQISEETSGIGLTGDGIYMWAPTDDTCLKFYDEDSGDVRWEIDSDNIFTGYINANHVLNLRQDSFPVLFESQWKSATYNFSFSANSYFSGWVNLLNSVWKYEIYFISINSDGVTSFNINTGDTNSLQFTSSGIFVVPATLDGQALQIQAYKSYKETSATTKRCIISVFRMNPS